MRLLAVAAFVIFLCSCDSKPTPEVKVAPKLVEIPRPTDETRRLPKTNLLDTIVVPKELLGKKFMPGGTLAQYRKGKTSYEMFIAKAASATDAAVILPDWQHALTDVKFIASFGGYFGRDAGRPVFVFTKGPWIAGVAGLEQKDADVEARKLARALE
jgi:hypothetical protein